MEAEEGRGQGDRAAARGKLQRGARNTAARSPRLPPAMARVSLQLHQGLSIGIAAVSHDSPGRSRRLSPTRTTTRCEGLPQHGLSSKTMTLITSDSGAARSLGIKMGPITSGCVPSAGRPGLPEGLRCEQGLPRNFPAHPLRPRPAPPGPHLPPNPAQISRAAHDRRTAHVLAYSCSRDRPQGLQL